MTLTEYETCVRDVVSACRLYGITDVTSIGRTYCVERDRFIPYAQIDWDAFATAFEGAEPKTWRTPGGEHAELTMGDIHWTACRLTPAMEQESDIEIALS